MTPCLASLRSWMPVPARRPRGVAAAVLGILVLAQGVSLAHLANHAHVLNGRTGRVVHAQAPGAPAQPAPGTPGSADEECEVFALLQQARLHNACAVFSPAQRLVEEHPLDAERRSPARWLNLFLLAPSQSPPA